MCGCGSGGSSLCNSRLVKGRSCDNAKPWGECARADTRAVRGTADREEYSEQLILGSIKQLILFENQNVGSGW